MGNKVCVIVVLKYHSNLRVCMDWVDRTQNYKGLYGILPILQGSQLDNFPLKSLLLGLVGYHSLTFQLKCVDFNLIAPVLSRFCHREPKIS